MKRMLYRARLRRPVRPHRSSALRIQASRARLVSGGHRRSRRNTFRHYALALRRGHNSDSQNNAMLQNVAGLPGLAIALTWPRRTQHASGFFLGKAAMMQAPADQRRRWPHYVALSADEVRGGSEHLLGMRMQAK